MKPLKYVATLVVLTLCLSIGSFGTAAPSKALTAPRMTPVERVWALAVYTLLNVERLTHGLPPLRFSHRLVHSGMYHNRRMARANTLSHQLPHEPAFTDRELAFGYHWVTAGENCSVNPDVSQAGVLQLQRMMYQERPPGEIGHRQNILSPNFRAVGIAVLIDPVNERVWMTEDFGRAY